MQLITLQSLARYRAIGVGTFQIVRLEIVFGFRIIAVFPLLIPASPDFVRDVVACSGVDFYRDTFPLKLRVSSQFPQLVGRQK
jgi:hypothetical protein